MSELPENLLNELHKKEKICTELEGLANASGIDYQSEIARLTDAYNSTGAIPPEYAELLDKRFAQAVKSAQAGEAQYLAAQEKFAQLTAKTDALIAAIDEAEAALNSGNQDAINQAYDKLSAAFEAYKDALKKLSEGQIVEVEKEVEVEPEVELEEESTPEVQPKQKPKSKRKVKKGGRKGVDWVIVLAVIALLAALAGVAYGWYVSTLDYMDMPVEEANVSSLQILPNNDLEKE